MRLASISIIILLIAGTLGWYRLYYTNPSEVFSRMLHNSLSTPGVTKVVSQSDTDQQLDQRAQLVTTPTQRVRSTVILRQGAGGDTLITTESIGTTHADYVRYADLKTNQKTAEGKDFNFAAILNIWGKADSNDTTSGGAQLYNQTVLGVVPVGNLDATLRQQLLNQIINDNVYTVNYATIKKTKQAGRPVYSYDVSVMPVAYVSMLKAYARDIGLKQLEPVDPNQYAGSAPLKFNFNIDVWSGALTQITYKDSKRTEKFSSYGVHPQIELPTKTVPIEQLQSKLQEIQ